MGKQQKWLKLAAGLAVWFSAIPAANAASSVPASYTGEVTATSLNVRMSPGTSGRVIGSLPKGSKLTVIPYNQEWVKLTYKGKLAYAARKYMKPAVMTKMAAVKPAASVRGTVKASTLNMRSTSSTAGKIVGVLKKSETVTVLKEYKGWYYVQAGTRKGWVLGSYITKLPAAKAPAVKPPTAPAAKASAASAPKPATVTAVPAAAIPAKPVADNYQMLDIRYPSKVSAAEINAYIQKYETSTKKKSVFHNQGELFIRVGKEYGINQLILAAMAIHESAYGTNDLSRGKFNLFSVAAYDSAPFDSAYRFANVEQAVRYQAYFLRTQYITPTSWKFKGYHLGDKKAGLNYYYASDPAWGAKIAAHAGKIRPFQAAEYSNITLMTGTGQKVTLTNSAELFSETALATAKAKLTVYDRLDNGKEIGEIPAGAQFSVLAKYNLHAFKVKYEDKVGYVSFSFSSYKNYIQIHNIVRTIQDSVKVFDDKGNVVKTLPNFTYVEQVLEEGKPVIANYRTKVKIDGRALWISIWDKLDVYR